MNIGISPDTLKNSVVIPSKSSTAEVVVIGAGPYGLAVAAHLRSAGLALRVFGEPMDFWRRNMPKGMKLRSPWRASHIADPGERYSLETYTADTGKRRSENFPLEDFVNYGEWFAGKAVPDLDRRKVTKVEQDSLGFRISLEDGETVEASRVVIAMGLRNQEFRPPQFDGLPFDLVSHSSEHDDLGKFRGKRVAVIGRGQSALESAVLLSEGGADVELISRGPVRWIGSEMSGGTPSEALLWSVHGMMTAPSAVGPFPLNWLIDMPDLMRMLPAAWREKISIRSLRPAASAWLRPRAGRVRVSAGRNVIAAKAQGNAVALSFDDGSSAVVDHVLLATGYRMDVGKFGVLAPELLARIDTDEGYPRLSNGFQSSVPGLHFVGSSAVKSYGGLMRFVAGAGYAARNLTRVASASQK